MPPRKAQEACQTCFPDPCRHAQHEWGINPADPPDECPVHEHPNENGMCWECLTD